MIFVSHRNGSDAGGYAAAAAAMATLAAAQPGYRGADAVRDGDGMGITVSYWASEADALRWRDHPEHRAIREAGRARWYDRYTVSVARIERDYRWSAA